MPLLLVINIVLELSLQPCTPLPEKFGDFYYHYVSRADLVGSSSLLLSSVKDTFQGSFLVDPTGTYSAPCFLLLVIMRPISYFFFSFCRHWCYCIYTPFLSIISFTAGEKMEEGLSSTYT